MNVQHITGIEGEVELFGYRAVVGHFLRWTLERRGADGTGQPVWTLRASFSFQKNSMLLNHEIAKKITVRSPLGDYAVTPLPGVEPKIVNDTQYLIEGVTLCRLEKQQKTAS